MHTRLIRWSRMVYLAGIVLAIVAFIPTAWFPFQLAKVAIFATLLLVAIILFVCGRGVKDLLHTHGLYAALAVLALPLAYLVSTIFSTNKSLSLLGFSLEADTLVFVVLISLAFILSFTLFRTLRTVRMLLSAVFWTLTAAVVFQLLVLVFGNSLIPLGAFADRSVNLVGKWNDLGLLVALLSVFVLSQLELASLSPLKKAGFIALGAVAAFVLLVINFALAWGFVLAFSLALGVVTFFVIKREAAVAPMQRTPWFAAAAAVLAILCIFFGTTFNAQLTKLVPVSSLEVRPSYSSTMNIVSAAQHNSFERILVGTGPGTFVNSWLSHKPAEVNQSLFWNLDFNVGFSTLVTALGTVGLLGAIAWLIPILLIIAGIVRVIRLGVLSREEKITATTVSLLALGLLAAIVLYIPSQNSILLAFTLAGSAFGFLWRQGQASTAAAEGETEKITTKFLSVGMALALLVLIVWGTFLTDRRAVAESYTNAGLTALGAGNADTALSRANISERIEKNPNNLRLAIDARNIKLQQIATDQKLPAADAQQQFAALLQETIQKGKDATAMYPQDYRMDLSLGRVYDFLTSLKIDGAYENAKQSYEAAAVKNPTDPEIPLLVARLEATKGNTQLADKAITQSLTLKPNYTDAILFVVQLDVANNDIPNAIRAATAATQTAPGVAPIWFELGLLYYASNDMPNAIPALEKAISIVPDYANAKYFLGLAYYNQKRTADAVKEFQELAASNADSTEVGLILSNLKNGKDPFASSTPPITSQPEKRATAPFAE